MPTLIDWNPILDSHNKENNQNLSMKEFMQTIYTKAGNLVEAGKMVNMGSSGFQSQLIRLGIKRNPKGHTIPRLNPVKVKLDKIPSDQLCKMSMHEISEEIDEDPTKCRATLLRNNMKYRKTHGRTDWNKIANKYNLMNNTNHSVKSMLESVYKEHSNLHLVGADLNVSHRTLKHKMEEMGIVRNQFSNKPSMKKKFEAIPNGEIAKMKNTDVVKIINCSMNYADSLLRIHRRSIRKG
jgi:hypothetical protein